MQYPVSHSAFKRYLITVHAPVPCSHCCYDPEQQAWRHGSSPDIQNVFPSGGISGTWSGIPETNLNVKNY